MDYVQDLLSNREMFFNFMKEKYSVFQNSNIFLRDIQYAVQSYYQKKEKKVKYGLAEKVTLEFITHLENEGQLKKISYNAWKVNFSTTSNVTTITEGKVETN
jgi:hypothetical protein